MTAFLLFVKHHLGWLWLLVEWANGQLFRLFYPGLERMADGILRNGGSADHAFSLVDEDDLPNLSHFLSMQPADHTAHFRPHAFDIGSLRWLHANPAFLQMEVTRRTDGELVGYFFLRCFFIGRAFLGLLVDRSAAGKGIGTEQWRLMKAICQASGLRMFATVSAQNTASLTSLRKATEVKVVEKLPSDYLLIELNNKA